MALNSTADRVISTRLVIPADASPDDRAFDHRPETWTEIARDNRVDLDAEGRPLIENFGSAWCVENGIDGLGICTEDSGQETPKQRVEREAREEIAQAAAAAIAAAQRRRVEATLDLLVENKVLSVAEADAVRAVEDPVEAGMLLGSLAIEER
jgi:hypothetical protein